ncbi:helix-turn-helix transcriptional regulator [Noviherbaspirillum aerium]|uniref:helix-turn-helix transcriptional regulator n=1 Tax=Noviherbaspirillum aerium TaxID=2588497 RepID=UPI00124DE759|nr:helix-turn-helix transcriptional regulator [Noviherbaspirillum aerium]
MDRKLPIGNDGRASIVFPLTVATVREIGSAVQAMRKEQGLTQLDVAGLAGLGNRFVVELEKGKETVQMQKALDVLALLGLELVVRRKGEQ